MGTGIPTTVHCVRDGATAGEGRSALGAHVLCFELSDECGETRRERRCECIFELALEAAPNPVILLGYCGREAALGRCGSRVPLLLGRCGHEAALGCCGSRVPLLLGRCGHEAALGCCGSRVPLLLGCCGSRVPLLLGC